ncbi:methionine synthase [Aquipuribacter nitratireducens]|uniref:Methionine synthase n=1 Tax=Aquipuribacter nitratireducens TaxID=650104 RepID=A0ABW0GII0_9MICO
MTSGATSLVAALAERVVVADGAMGTMLQAAAPSLDDMDGHDGCNEVLNVNRPDIVRGVHDAYLEAGADCIETNTFGANLGNLGEYGIEDRVHELSLAGARIARHAADAWSTPGRPRWVIGSVGPGTRLPSLGHTTFAALRDGYEQQARGLLEGGVDLVLVETVQDLLQAKAAVVGARRAMAALGLRVPVYVQVTVETTGTMLLGSETPAALTVLRGLRVDGVGLNCATGPAEMGEHVRHLSRHADAGLSVMPNAGLPVLAADGARYPLAPGELADAHELFTGELGVALVGGCCGTTPEHVAAVVDRVGGRRPARRRPRPEPGVASLYTHVPFRQDVSYLSIGERTNANGSKAFREAMLEARWDDVVDIARGQTRDGAHLLDVCVDYVGRDGVADAVEVVGRLATASTLPLVVDSTEPEVVERALELTGGRCVVNSVNYEDGDGPGSRFERTMRAVVEHGAAVVALTIDETGQARTAEHKVAVAERLLADLTDRWGMREEDVVVDTLTFPIATGQEETRRDGLETLEAIRALTQRHPSVQTTLGVSNVSFGLNPAARAVLNSVFLHEAVKAGLSSAIVHPSRILPLSRIPAEQLEVALDLVHDRRRPGYDPLERYLELFEGVSAADQRAERAAALLQLPLGERLAQRIVEGERNGLEADLDEAIAQGRAALDIINDHLLAGMKVVGELFGKGEMQLPFVLTSAEVMKAAVAHLEPHIERTDDSGRGTIVLATVKGDVHDIGKNLVDIILTNNGYTVVNLGIKQPVAEMLRAAQEHRADVLGMSGLLVKSTVVMRENLEEINARGIAADLPVLLGGAALTRAYVENDLAEVYEGEVRYARDAFEGLRLMDAVMQVKRGERDALPAPRPRRVRPRPGAVEPVPEGERAPRSDVDPEVTVPTPPFWGTRVVKGIPVADYVGYLDERATFLGQWGLRGSRADGGPSYEELVETEGRPRLRAWLDRVRTEGLLEAGVVYGYLPVAADGDDLCVLAGHEGDALDEVVVRWRFPRQRRDRRLCLADFHKDRAWVAEHGRADVLGVQLVTMGPRVADATAELFAKDAYRDYLELHGLSVQLTEALAERWHARVREELGLAGDDAGDLQGILDQGYRGSRYSFGYPACPDLEHRRDLVRLLRPDRIGVELSEELQLHPEQSTDAIVVHHPEAKYFNAT